MTPHVSSGNPPRLVPDQYAGPRWEQVRLDQRPRRRSPACGGQHGPRGQNARRCDPWYHSAKTKAKSRESLTRGSRWTGSTTHLHWRSGSHRSQSYGQSAYDPVVLRNGTRAAGSGLAAPRAVEPAREIARNSSVRDWPQRAGTRHEASNLSHGPTTGSRTGSRSPPVSMAEARRNETAQSGHSVLTVVDLSRGEQPCQQWWTSHASNAATGTPTAGSARWTPSKTRSTASSTCRSSDGNLPTTLATSASWRSSMRKARTKAMRNETRSVLPFANSYTRPDAHGSDTEKMLAGAKTINRSAESSPT